MAKKTETEKEALGEFFEISEIIKQYTNNYKYVRVIDHSRNKEGLKIEIFINWRLVKVDRDRELSNNL
mgnify:CR=1 FL=1